MYFDELAKKRRKDAKQSSAPRGLTPSHPNEVVVTEEEVDEDE